MIAGYVRVVRGREYHAVVFGNNIIFPLSASTTPAPTLHKR
jgi:hypothetical protein